MSRQPRTNLPDAIYHLTSRGVEKRPVFMNAQDNQVFLRYLTEAMAHSETSLLAYCLMGNHFHLMVASRLAPISDVMHHLLTRYSIYFNRAYQRTGHLFQGRFHSELCEDLAYLIHLPVYIHLNPVRAKLVERVSDWPWSSHQELVDGKRRHLDLSRLETLTGMTPENLRERYLERVTAKDAPTEPRIDAIEMLQRLAAKHGVEISAIRAGRRSASISTLKTEFLVWARSYGVPDAVLAQLLGCTREAVRQHRSRYCHSCA